MRLKSLSYPSEFIHFAHTIFMSLITLTGNDSIKLPLQFDVAKMQKEVAALSPQEFNYYSVLMLLAPAHEVDSSIPFPKCLMNGLGR